MLKNKQKTAQILKGMIEPFGGTFSFYALFECISQGSAAITALDVAAKDLEAAYTQ